MMISPPITRKYFT